MKFVVAILILSATYLPATAQTPARGPNPKARALTNIALEKFHRADGNKDTLALIGRILDSVIKIDGKTYEWWVNKLSFQCNQDQFEKGLQTATKMIKLFPKQTDPVFYSGLLQYKTGKRPEAIATFRSLLNTYNARLTKNIDDPVNRPTLFNKGILLIILDRSYEGKTLLKKLYDSEKDPMVQSNIAFYFNADRETIINDRIPGK